MDLNTRAFAVVSRATDETSESDGGRREAARKAGRLGGAARAKVLTPQRRREIAVKANQARWNGSNEQNN